MYIDYSRAKEIFALMLERYQGKRYPFQNMEEDLPQHLVLAEVTADPLRLARHLFFSCHYMRGTVISSHAFRVLNDLQKESPWLFTEDILVLTTPLQVSQALGSKIKWHQEAIGKAWLQNARTLHREWKGDPRNIFRGVKSKETLYRRVMGRKYRPKEPNRYTGFIGFQEKMTSMLAYFLEATGLIEPNPLSAPIDFHHFRVYLATGMINVTESEVRYEKVKRLGIQLAERLQRDFGLSQVEYGDVIWLWSLRSCRRSPHNRTIEVEHAESRRLTREVVPVVWSPNQIGAHERTCGRCYIADHCSFGIPAGIYYKSGVFRLIPRMSPPQGNIFAAVEIPYESLEGRRHRDEFRSRFDGEPEERRGTQLSFLQ